MEDIHSEFKRASKVVREFIEKKSKYKNRYASLLTMMETFIERANLSDCAKVNEMILVHALIDYYEDILRLKEFHEVGHVNNIKIVSYTSYWLLQAKPIQLTKNDITTVHINERFVLSYILTYLESQENGRILERSEPAMRAFAESLLYFFKYRTFTAQSIEMALISFMAGRVYQDTDTDLSSQMGKLIDL